VSWLTFVEVHDTGKTKVWDVRNAENGSLLGQVRWHGAWRQYVYSTAADVVWNPACLDELAAFIRDQMAARRSRAAV